MSGGDESMSEEEIRRIVEQAVRETLHEMLPALGIDISSPETRIQVQVDMAWLRRQRRASEQVEKLVKRTAIALVVSGLLAALWTGIRAAIRGKGL